MSSLIRTFARPARSVNHGVGARAIQRIPKGAVIAPPIDLDGKWYDIEKLHELGIIEPGPIEMMFDFVCPGPDGDQMTGHNIFVPDKPLTTFPLQMFINHSLDPNVFISANNKVTAIRDINVGEELTENYNNLCGPNFIKQM
uniref:SET domain-containing protein n=1 Tax=viral metagenome TaxID=1070528 RepID=A0A6C0FB68_9ZZZZ|tara:strand:- start:613 stop:1038 length:426 start_codon:yes stop_codon:yes gene_type:complete